MWIYYNKQCSENVHKRCVLCDGCRERVTMGGYDSPRSLRSQLRGWRAPQRTRFVMFPVVPRGWWHKAIRSGYVCHRITSPTCLLGSSLATDLLPGAVFGELLVEVSLNDGNGTTRCGGLC